MSNHFHQLLHLVVDRLRETEFIKEPPAILVVPEEDEPSEDRPGQGDSLSDQVDGALARIGAGIIVYIESVDITNQGADEVEIRVQVVENVTINRHSRGSRKTCWNLLVASRNALDGFQHAEHQEWAPLQFLGIQTVQKDTPLIREVRFVSRSFVPRTLQG